jgi:hypothetical protein
MPARRFVEQVAPARLLMGALVFGACFLTGQSLAQPGYVPRVPPPPPPIFNPSPSNTTVPQPSYQSISPATLSTPVNEGVPSSTTRSHRRAATAKMRSVYHHHYRGHIARSTLGSHYCGYSPCVRIHLAAFYGYAGPASGLWWPGYYDYAPGQFGRGRPRYWGYWRQSGYHGD